MASKGKCQVQLYDVDVDDLRFELITNPPGDSTKRPDSEIDWVIQHFFQRYFEKTSACADASRYCVPVDDNPNWTDWQENMAPGETVKVDLDLDVHCECKVSGYYNVSSAVVDGVCMKYSPSVFERRLRSNKRNGWKKKMEKENKDLRKKKWF
jgi:hypothetical protein